MKKYAYGWLTALFFLVSIAGHWVFGWFAYVDEAIQHGQRRQSRFGRKTDFAQVMTFARSDRRGHLIQ